MTDDDSCRCARCDRLFQTVEAFDLHRFRGRCRKFTAREEQERAALDAARREGDAVRREALEQVLQDVAKRMTR
jgi:hypothetical protein